MEYNYNEYVSNALTIQNKCGKISTITDLEHYCYMRRKEIIEYHKGAITEITNGKYKGQFQTNAYEPNTGIRKVLRAKSKSELEDKIVTFYSGQDNRSKHTIDECFNGWIDYLSIDKKPSSIRFYKQVYKRHFGAVKELYIEDWTGYQIKVFSKKEVSDEQLTQKGYSIFKTVLFGIYHFAKDNEYIGLRIEDIASELKRELRGSFFPSKRMLRQDCEFVLSEAEEKKILTFCINSDRLDDLGIALMLKTGIRVGEEASLLKDDISADRNIIFVSKTEERISTGAEYVVSERPKTVTGIRKVLLTSDAKEIVERILDKSASQSEYLFADSQLDRYPAKKFRDRLRRICKYVDIPFYSPHTLRRTYITGLFERKVPEEIIIKQVGHIDIDITKKYYVFNRRSDEQVIEILEKSN